MGTPADMDSLANILLLLSSMAVNWPVLANWGLELAKMLLLVVPEGQSKVLAECLIGRHTRLIDEFARDIDLKASFAQTNSAFILYRFRQTSKSLSFLSDLISIGELESFAGEPVGAMILAISEDFPIGISRESAFTINLEGSLRGLKATDISKVVPDDNQIPVVREMVNVLCSKTDNHDLAAFTAAACFCYPKMSEEERDSLFPGLLKTAEKLVETNDILSEPEDISDLIIGELLQWRETKDFSQAYELPFLDEEAYAHLESSVLFNEDYVYMSETLFKNAASRLLKVYPVMKVLESLKTNGVLKCDSTKAATTRISFYGPDGNYNRTRMLRFIRKKLTKLGDQPFVEACLSAKGDSDYES